MEDDCIASRIETRVKIHFPASYRRHKALSHTYSAFTNETQAGQLPTDRGDIYRPTHTQEHAYPDPLLRALLGDVSPDIVARDKERLLLIRAEQCGLVLRDIECADADGRDDACEHDYLSTDACLT